MTAPSPSLWRRLATGILLGVAAAAATPAPRAQALVAPVQEGPWYKQIQVDLFASLSYTYNANHPATDENEYRVFDFDDDEAKLDVLSLTVQRAASKPGELGFRVDLGAGQSIPEITAARGLFRNVETGEAGHFDVEQAYVSYVADVGRGLRFDVGKFFAPVGYESVDRFDAYNDNFTHSFLFGFSAPFTNTGIKVTYPFSDKLSGMVMLVQGWDNVSDNNSSKSGGAQIVWTPSPSLGLTLNYIGGPEQNDNTTNWRNVYDLCATWKPGPSLALGLNADYGHERDALGPGQNGHWDGAALYANYGVTDRFSLALRAERLNDYEGARTGTPQRLEEVTLTPAYKIGGHFVLRVDLRQDWSNRAVFERGEGWSKDQFTASINVLLVF
jgi:hypothetical protein